jgi:hypothetical protein
VRAFFISGIERGKERYREKSDNKEKERKKGVPKELGEYVDFEEIDEDT